MPKVKELNKHSKRDMNGKETKHSTSIQRSHNDKISFEHRLKEFTQTHKNDVRNIKMNLKCINDEKHTMQMTIMDNKENIRFLQEQIQVKEEEIAKCHNEEQELRMLNNTQKQQLEELRAKFATLEILYDKNLTESQRELQLLQREIEKYKQSHQQNIQEFEENRTELQNKLNEKGQELSNVNEQLLEMKKTLDDNKREIQELQDTINRTKAQINEEKHQQIKTYELKLVELQEEIKTKDHTIIKCRKEIKDLEETKNKIIDEQAFKIREIERVFDQPVKRVTPNNAAAKHQSTMWLENIDQQPTTIVATSTAATTAPTTSRAVVNPASFRSNPKQSIQQKQQQQQHSQRQQTPIQTRLKSKRSLRSTANNEIRNDYFDDDDNDDDDSSEYSGWHPAFNIDNIGSPKDKYNSSRKRAIEDDIFIAETSESDKFEALKRSKT